jgi:hypothetical protein
MKTKSVLAWALIYGLPFLVVAGIIYAIVAPDPYEGKSTREIAMICTTDMATQFHIHPQLVIKADGEPYVLPANIGVTRGCMNPLHTHDSSGEIHVESPVQVDFTLGDFFAVWGKSIGDFGTLERLSVNGIESTNVENLILRDRDEILLEYKTS